MSTIDRIVYSATLPHSMRSEIESLFFFNGRQSRRREGIHATISRDGMPAIVQSKDRVWIEVPPGHTQCLFACDAAVHSMRPIGALVYGRPAVDTIRIAHVAIDPDYAHGGPCEALNVAVHMLARVRTIASSITGVTRIQLPYREGRYLRIAPSQSD